MDSTLEKNKRLAKNTLVLYLRMLVMMLISFYTTRITLHALGFVDYGLYNVIGGLVSMFTILSASLSGSVSRFISFNLGINDIDKLKRVFVISIDIHIMLAFIIVILIETFGVWFLNNKMLIPTDRLYASNWVLQCSVFSFGLGLLSIPYNAAIIAHERMSAFAYMTIFDALSRLAIVFAIYMYPEDKLILLAILNLLPVLVTQFIYWLYCKKNFEECVYSLTWDKQIFREMFSFAGWNFIGCTAGLMKDHGVNVVVNLFAGPVVNAARGIAMQVNGVVSRFIYNFTTAMNPQIIKEYSVGNLDRVHTLIFLGTRFSYFIFMLLSIPLLFEIEDVLILWLGKIPEHTVLFTRLVLILTLSDIISETLIKAQLATGKIKTYQIVVGGILLLNLPLSYVCLYFGLFPEITVIIAICISQICLFARFYFLRKMIQLSISKFLRKVYLNVILVTILSSIAPFFCYLYLPDGFGRVIILTSISILTSIAAIYYVGCDENERSMLKSLVLKMFNGKLKR